MTGTIMLAYSVCEPVNKSITMMGLNRLKLTFLLKPEVRLGACVEANRQSILFVMAQHVKNKLYMYHFADEHGFFRMENEV